MGETASTWKVPLHSSDTEHPWMRRREEKGKGAAFVINRTGETKLPQATAGDPTNGIQHPGVNASSVLSNPFHHQSSPTPNNRRG